MPIATLKPGDIILSADEIAEFVALKTHAEKVKYFAEHKSLANVFHSTIFAANTLPAIVAPSKSTVESPEPIK